MRAVYWFQSSNYYAATKGKPEGELNSEQQEAFEKLDTLFKSALLSILDDFIVDSYMFFDTGKDMWDALEAKFGASDAGSELYVMEQFYDYKMMSVLLYNRLMRYSHSLRKLSTSSVIYRTSLLPVALSPSFHLHGATSLLL